MWALDLGTTNTLLARWDDNAGRPSLLELPGICRGAADADPLCAPRAVPSAVHVFESPSWLARLGEAPAVARRAFLGKLGDIGQRALDRNRARHGRSFLPSFKRELALAPLRTVLRAGRRGYTAREVGRLFVRELVAEAKAATGTRIRDLVITSPVESFETYRAELVAIAQGLGVKRVRFIDEPVAAALGYGLGLSRGRVVLVVDFGGGTLHMAMVRLRIDQAREGHSDVIAKAGRDAGGRLVDLWLLEELCRRLGYELREDEGEEHVLWRRLMLAEACRVKEAVYFEPSASFAFTPPEALRSFDARLRGDAAPPELTRADLVRLLTERGLYRTVESCLEEVLAQAKAAGASGPDDVLMVGGSTLLPEIYSMFESRFGRARVRAWQPFEAVAYGGAVFAAGQVEPADFIVHDYAMVTYDRGTHKPEYTVVVPRGTRFPTEPAFWQRQLVPTCSLGEPERMFKLVICELGQSDGDRRFSWDASGQLHQLSTAGEKLVVKLNEAHPTLGYLDPPHSPRDTRPRLEISLGVNHERWLCATVLDLRTQKHLMRNEPVVRLL